jgi:hypothetical protein
VELHESPTVETVHAGGVWDAPRRVNQHELWTTCPPSRGRTTPSALRWPSSPNWGLGRGSARRPRIRRLWRRSSCGFPWAMWSMPGGDGHESAPLYGDPGPDRSLAEVVG